MVSFNFCGTIMVSEIMVSEICGDCGTKKRTNTGVVASYLQIAKIADTEMTK